MIEKFCLIQEEWKLHIIYLGFLHQGQTQTASSLVHMEGLPRSYLTRWRGNVADVYKTVIWPSFGVFLSPQNTHHDMSESVLNNIISKYRKFKGWKET